MQADELKGLQAEPVLSDVASRMDYNAWVHSAPEQ